MKNENPKAVHLHEAAPLAYSLLNGTIDFGMMGKHERDYWTGISRELIAKASNWIVFHTTSPSELVELDTWLRDLSKYHPHLMIPDPHEDVISDVIEIRRLQDAEFSLVWRDVCINYYKRPGRCMCMSRILTSEEIKQFKEELLATLALHQNNP